MHLQQPRADRAACTEWDVTWDAWQEARLAVRHALAHASHAVRHAASSARVRVVWCLQVHDMVRQRVRGAIHPAASPAHDAASLAHTVCADGIKKGQFVCYIVANTGGP